MLIVAGGLVLDIIQKISGFDPGRCVANAHTLFKICQVLILLPFTRGIVKLTYLAVPGDDQGEDTGFQLFYIGKTSMFSPTTAVIEAVRGAGAYGGRWPMRT